MLALDKPFRRLPCAMCKNEHNLSNFVAREGPDRRDSKIGGRGTQSVLLLGMISKACSKCQIVKSMTEFYSHRGHKDGRRSECKECKNESKRVLRGSNGTTRCRPANCELCGQTRTHARALCADHDHETGAFRGWLCTGCNVALGRFGDNVEGLRRAIDYLHRAWLTDTVPT